MVCRFRSGSQEASKGSQQRRPGQGWRRIRSRPSRVSVPRSVAPARRGRPSGTTRAEGLPRRARQDQPGLPARGVASTPGGSATRQAALVPVGSAAASTWSARSAIRRPRSRSAVRVTRNRPLRNDHSARSAWELEIQTRGRGGVPGAAEGPSSEAGPCSAAQVGPSQTWPRPVSSSWAVPPAGGGRSPGNLPGPTSWPGASPAVGPALDQAGSGGAARTWAGREAAAVGGTTSRARSPDRVRRAAGPSRETPPARRAAGRASGREDRRTARPRKPERGEQQPSIRASSRSGQPSGPAPSRLVEHGQEPGPVADRQLPGDPSRSSSRSSQRPGAPRSPPDPRPERAALARRFVAGAAVPVDHRASPLDRLPFHRSPAPLPRPPPLPESSIPDPAVPLCAEFGRSCLTITQRDWRAGSERGDELRLRGTFVKRTGPSDYRKCPASTVGRCRLSPAIARPVAASAAVSDAYATAPQECAPDVDDSVTARAVIAGIVLSSILEGMAGPASSARSRPPRPSPPPADVPSAPGGRRSPRSWSRGPGRAAPP